eukprot:CAMPEP_0184458552 /NCGR_PEP_ID=MMETSP0740-20130409/33662_1 /TAXON_ID=385413 /ORGANISM="Thalassiosira miniscula, Strain CCMP1093" /LENGTH=140 /DNA_ID=CAMNT_0026831243 /DNA_START=235 /DNA_END=658 /DNA_ORIENTATION=-
MHTIHEEKHSRHLDKLPPWSHVLGLGFWFGTFLATLRAAAAPALPVDPDLGVSIVSSSRTGDSVFLRDLDFDRDDLTVLSSVSTGESAARRDLTLDLDLDDLTILSSVSTGESATRRDLDLDLDDLILLSPASIGVAGTL